MARRSPRPVAVFAPGSGVTAVAAGGVHTCAVVAGAVLCWGGNWDGQGGTRRPYIAVEPQRAADAAGAFRIVAAGARHTCASGDRDVWCWGANGVGQSGGAPCLTRGRRCVSAPAQIDAIDGVVGALGLGIRSSCAIVDGGVLCWGGDDRGQLGDGSGASRALPGPVSGLPDAVDHLAVGGEHACAAAGDRIWCWGANDRGQLGDGTTADRDRATAVRSLDGRVVALAAGEAHTCAATASGVWCWGAGDEGQVDGAPRAAPVSTPQRIPGFAADVSALAAGVDLSCAARTGGSVTCWGAGDFGQLGDGRPDASKGPTSVAAWDDGRLRDRNGDGRITVACLGDSNTQTSPAMPRKWCESLGEIAASRGWRVVNRGEAGATAVSEGSMIVGEEALEYALRNDEVDAVILAYGTNDLRIAGITPSDVSHAYAELRRRTHESGVDVFFGTTPPPRSESSPLRDATAELNALLTRSFPASRIVDFWSGLTPDDFVDELHLAESGHDLRAQRAWEVLAAAAPDPEAN